MPYAARQIISLYTEVVSMTIMPYAAKQIIILCSWLALQPSEQCHFLSLHFLYKCINIIFINRCINMSIHIYHTHIISYHQLHIGNMLCSLTLFSPALPFTSFICCRVCLIHLWSLPHSFMHPHSFIYMFFRACLIHLLRLPHSFMHPHSFVLSYLPQASFLCPCMSVTSRPLQIKFSLPHLVFGSRTPPEGAQHSGRTTSQQICLLACRPACLPICTHV